jgi:hypothetical protein
MSSHIPAPGPGRLERLTRPQIAARVGALRLALDGLANQSDLDGGPVLACTGAMKKHLIELEERLRSHDHAAPMPARLAGTPWQPSERQVADYRALIGSPVFTEEERARGLRWLEQNATRQTIGAQVEWLREQVARRPSPLSAVVSDIQADMIRAAGGGQ